MKSKYFLFLCLSFLIFNSSLLIGTIRYVSKTGTSTPPYTSWQTAADSIQKCINICVDGDTIYVANGVYKENLVINTAISLIGNSMDSTVIDGTGLTDFTIEYNKSGYLENFKIFGKSLAIPNVIIFSVIPSNRIIVNNCIMVEAGTAVGMARGDIKVNNLIMYNVDRGVHIFGEEYNQVSNCIIMVSMEGSSGVVIGFAGSVEYKINNNIILFTGDRFTNPDYGITGQFPHHIEIYNNLISGFSENIRLTVPDTTAEIKNNILCNLPRFGVASLTLNSGTMNATNLVLINNKVAIKNFTGGTTFSNYNLFWLNETNYSGVTPGNSDFVADPMFVNDTIPTPNGGYDFHLQKYSPAIDKGDPSILDVDGSRSDIGLFGGPLGQSYTYQDLAPKPPRNLTAVMDSGLVHLKWNKNTEADIFRYRVYRDTVPDFIYDTTKIIAVISDTTYYDDPPQKFISGNYYYKVTAIDSAYHQSPASEEAHINITGIPEAPPIVVEHYNLLQNYPNPFNPSTTIPYRLKSPGYVKVMVYNLLGEQVKVLVNKYQSAGYYEVLFHPTATERQSAEGKIEFETGYGDIVSGIYLYRIEVIGEGKIPVFTDMKKMMLVK